MKMKSGCAAERDARFSHDAVVNVEPGHCQAGFGLQIKVAEDRVVRMPGSQFHSLFGEAAQSTEMPREPGYRPRVRGCFPHRPRPGFVFPRAGRHRVRAFPADELERIGFREDHRLRADGQRHGEDRPPSGNGCAEMSPLCSRMIAMQMLRPSPVPRPGTLGGEERIENSRQYFAADADAVVLERDQHAVADFPRRMRSVPWSRISRMACSAFTMRFRNTCMI